MDEESFIALLGVDYKREGGLYKICCPFHTDRHPSLVVYPQDRGYCCYPCARTGSWVELYKEMKGCEWAEAYEVLGIEGDYEAKPARPRFEFVDSEDDKFIEAINQRFDQCLPLDCPEAAPARAFLEKKHILETAIELDWRWDKGVFLQSKPRGALVIPYREDGKLVSVRLRTLELDSSFSKPKTLKGTHARPYVLTREGKDELYICEGETDALSLYASGCSVVAVPGAGQKKCINTAVLYCELMRASTIVSCGDNDGPGKLMNELAQKASHALTTASFKTLPPDALGGLNDINDAYVAGKLRLTPTFEDIFPGATEVTGWEGVYAKALFSDEDEIFEMVASEFQPASPEEQALFDGLFSANEQTMKEAWLKATPALQKKFEYLKDTMKLVVERNKPTHLTQTSIVGLEDIS